MKQSLLRATIGTAVTALCLTTLAACGGSSDGASNDSTPDKIVIGGIHPLTGPSSYYGIPQDKAIKLAVKQINADGGVSIDGTKVPLEYQSEDGKADPAAAVAALKKLQTGDSSIVIGPLSGAVGRALKPVAKQSGTTLVVDGAADANPGFTERGLAYRVPLGYDKIDKGLIAYIAESGYANVAMLNDQENPTFADSAKNVESGIESNGAKITSTKTFKTNDSDFRTQLTGLVKNGPAPDALVIRGYAVPCALATEQARQLGYKGPVVWEVSAPKGAIEAAVDSGSLTGVVNVHYPTPDLDRQAKSPNITKFWDAFKAEYGEDPGELAAYSYDAVQIIKTALESSKSTKSDDLHAALEQLKVGDLEVANQFRPQEGDLLFDADGQTDLPIIARTWKNDNWELIGEVGK